MYHPEHDGPCQIGLGFWCLAHREHTSAEYLRAAINWADDLPEFEQLIGHARAVLARWDAEPREHLKTLDRRVLAELHLSANRVEFEACVEIVSEAAQYWINCNYGDDWSMPEDQWLETESDLFFRTCGVIAWPREFQRIS